MNPNNEATPNSMSTSDRIIEFMTVFPDHKYNAEDLSAGLNISIETIFIALNQMYSLKKLDRDAVRPGKNAREYLYTLPTTKAASKFDMLATKPFKEYKLPQS